MGTHLGNGYFGKATGKRFVIRAIADCSAINNQINDLNILHEDHFFLVFDT